MRIGFLHLVEPHEEARVRVALGARRDVEIVGVVPGVRKRPAHVVGDAAGAQARSGDAPLQRLFGRQVADVDRAVLEDRVRLEQSAEVAHAARKLLDQRVEPGEIAVGQIAVDAADAHVVGMHARAAGCLLQVEDVLAKVEAVKEHRDRAQVDAVSAEPHTMRREPRELHREDANHLRAFRDAIGDAEQLFDRERVAECVRRRREVVHALDHGLRLRPEQAFRRLLDAGVQIADLGLGLHDVLAVDLEDDLQNAVRRWVLWPHREHHRVAALAHDLRRQRQRGAHDSRARLTSSCSASNVRPEGGVPATTLVLLAKSGRGERSRAGPRIG